MAKMTTAEALVETLLRHGFDTVYGLPGMHNDPLFDAFYMAKNRLRTIHTRHEQGAAYMALGAALATGKPQAFAVVPGPGFLSASAGLLTAYSMNAPVLAIVGQIPQADINRGHGQLHEIHDQLGIGRHYARFAARITAPYEAPLLAHEALTKMTTAPQRTAMLECALDVWGRQGEVCFPEIKKPEPAPIDADLTEAAAKLLGGARKPLIVVGGGAQDASKEITALAEMLQAPVVGFRRGRGVVPSSNYLSVTIPVGNRLWKEADVVLAIGTRLHMQTTQWGTDANLKVVRIDADPEALERGFKPAIAIPGDAATCAAALLAKVPAHNLSREPRKEEMASHAAWLAEKLEKVQPQWGWLQAIRRALPPEGIFVDEVTQAGFTARVGFPVEGPRTFLSPGYQDNLGWGYGAALGVKAARPDVPVVAITGDGGFGFQLGELATAALHNIGVISVIFDNQGYGNVKRLQVEKFGGRHIACDLMNPDFVKLAESFGIAGMRASNAKELESCLRKALTISGPVLIHVPHKETASPWELIRLPKVRG